MAFELADEDVDFAVFDASDKIAPATNAAAGMLAPSFEMHGGVLDGALYQFGLNSLALWSDFAARLEEESGSNIDFRRDGILGVALDDHKADALEDQVQLLNAIGGKTSFHKGQEIRALEPALSDRVIAGLLSEDEGQVDPRKTLIALRTVIRQRSHYVTSSVDAVRPAGDGWEISLVNGEQFEAKRIVVTAGAAATAISGINAERFIRPIKGEAVSIEMGANAPLTRVVRGPGAYLCPKSDGRMVVGASERENDRAMDVDEASIHALKMAAGDLVPVLNGAHELGRWAGIRPGTLDSGPVLGAGRVTGLFYAIGHYRNGILFAPASAMALAAQLLGRPCNISIDAFSVDRPSL